MTMKLTITTEMKDGQLWRASIHRMITEAHAKAVAAEVKFTAYAINHGMCNAIAVNGPDVAQAHGEWVFYAKVQETIQLAEAAGETEQVLAKELVALIDEQRGEALRQARNGFHSSGLFYNVVDEAKLSGFISALEGHYGQGGPRILRAVSDSGLIG